MLALLGVTACVEPPSGTDSTSTDTGQATTDETGTTSSGTTAPGTSSSDGTGSSGDGSSSTSGGVPEDPCLAFPPDACPADCSPVRTYPLAASECNVDLAEQVTLCVSVGEPLDPQEPTTFYAEIDGQVRYIVANQPCAKPMVATPVGWTECSDAPDAPEACRCLCGADGCPYEADLLLLEACGLPDPCGPTTLNDTNEASDHDLCVLAALRDRTPGAFGSAFTTGFTFDESRVFVDGSETAQLVHRHGDDLCFGPLDGVWEPTRTCTLQPPDWFDACIVDPTLWPDCLYGESWFQGCEDEPASCP